MTNGTKEDGEVDEEGGGKKRGQTSSAVEREDDHPHPSTSGKTPQLRPSPPTLKKPAAPSAASPTAGKKRKRTRSPSPDLSAPQSSSPRKRTSSSFSASFGYDSDSSTYSSTYSTTSSNAGLSAAAIVRNYDAREIPRDMLEVLQKEVGLKNVKVKEEGGTGKKKTGAGAGGRKTRSFGRLKFDKDFPPVRHGDVLEVKTATSGKGGCYFVVEDVRASEQDIWQRLDKNGNQTTQSGALLINGSWLYSRADFYSRHQDSAWKDRVYAMGPQERVKSDHIDWRPQSMIKSKGAENPYLRRLLPRCSSSRNLSLPFRTFSLLDLQPCPCPAAALKTPSSAFSTPADPLVPDFFFGLGALPGAEGRMREYGPLANVREGKEGGRKKDGRRGTAYVRATFTLQKQGEIEEEEGEAKVEGGGNGKKGGNGKGRKKMKKEKVWPLEFTHHSASRKPYNPRHTQVFSRSSNTWFETRELLEGEHYEPVVVATSSSGKKGKKDNDLADPSSLSLESRLSTLASSTIYRGGANGLTGNAYLVTRASSLLSLLFPSSSPAIPPPSALTSDARSTLEHESETLLSSAQEWEKQVEDRVKGVKEGKGLEVEWRRRGEPPEGCGWVDPETGKRC
ncbi:hypothetical protein JCM8547_006128 [Rhodosporidiobolus lusitaniae]